MSYVEILHDVESVFTTEDWTDNEIQAFPSSFAGVPATKEFIQIGTYPSQSNYRSFGSVNVAGYVGINIFTEKNVGDRRLFEIADILDDLLLSRIIGTLQFQTSLLNRAGSDIRYPLYNRGEYRINFREI